MIFDQIPWKVKKTGSSFRNLALCMTGKESTRITIPTVRLLQFKFVQNLEYEVWLRYGFLENIWPPASHLWGISSI